MEYTHCLLTVIDHFAIPDRGLIIAPWLSLPIGRWQNCVLDVLIVPPDGASFIASCHFILTHLQLTDLSRPIEQRWQIQPLFPALQKAQVPIGSVIFIPEHRAAMFLGHDPSQEAKGDGV